MHEQSETTQRPDGKWVNVYGAKTENAGQPLPIIFPFEKDAYDSLDEAESAAQMRSDLWGQYLKRGQQSDEGPMSRGAVDMLSKALLGGK